MDTKALRDPSERRRRALIAVVLILIMAGTAAVDALSEHAGALRLVDGARLAAVLLLSLVVSLRATTSFTLKRRDAALDDELTRANRASAATWGFWALMLTALAMAVASALWPVGLVELAPGVMVLGAAVAGLRFIFLERRGA
jgi:hypothetical protein